MDTKSTVISKYILLIIFSVNVVVLCPFLCNPNHMTEFENDVKQHPTHTKTTGTITFFENVIIIICQQTLKGAVSNLKL